MTIDRLSRIVAGRVNYIPVVSVEVDIHTIIADVVEELRLAWRLRMIEHQTHGDYRFVADPDRIAQVIASLGGNALTYGQSTMPVVMKSTVTTQELVMEVHNERAPIPEDLLPHIFESLRRGEQQVKLGSRSVGLGLYIVQEITAAHDGHVTVVSTAEEGTTFTVKIPAGPQPESIGS